MNRLKAFANDWIGLITMLGLMVAGFHHLDSKIDRMADKIESTLCRLEKMDGEFKIQMARQDAEFKAHMRYYHSVDS